MLPDLDSNPVQREQVEGVRHRDGQRTAHRVVIERNDLVLARGIRIDHLDRIRVRNHARQVDAFLLQRFAQRRAHDRLGGKSQVYQQLAQRLVYLFLFCQGDIQLIFGDNTFVDQDFTQSFRLFFRVHSFSNSCSRWSTSSRLKFASPLSKFSRARW